MEDKIFVQRTSRSVSEGRRNASLSFERGVLARLRSGFGQRGIGIRLRSARGSAAMTLAVSPVACVTVAS